MDAARSETKYERLRKIGIGSYGVVFKCVNRQTGQVVAIKRYSENDTDPIIRKIAMREVRMLRQLKHPNLIHLIEVFRRKRILHLVFDYCELTVLDVIEKYANNCPLNLIKKIIWQLVNGVNHCHALNCIHRDIKPENILINQSGVVKLCDFGFARNMSPPAQAAAAPGSMSAKQVKYEREAKLLGVSTNQMSQFMMNTGNKADQQQRQQQQMFELNKENLQSERLALTEYVATRWYRAPELLVGDVYYDKKIDIWAIGCVTAELMRGEPIWPGKTDLDQLFMIRNSLGALTASQTHTLLTQGLYDQANVERLLSQISLTDPLERKLPQRVGQAGMEFVFVCLQMDPAKRPICDELLQHHYIQSAQMGQFVRGASHAIGGQQSEQVNPTARGAGRHLHQLTDSRLDVRTAGQQASNARRTNSQAILMMANNQQPASKRPLIAPETGASGGAPPNSHQSLKHGSLAPAPVRSRRSEDSPSRQANWPHGSSSMQQQQQQNSKQQYKRKVAHVASERASLAVGQQTRGEQRTPSQINANLQRAAISRDSPIVSAQQAAGRKSRAVGKRDVFDEPVDGQRARVSKSIEMARRDRQQTNLGHHPHQNSNATRSQNTNSSASSSPTSFGTNKSSATSFLPPVQR